MDILKDILVAQGSTERIVTVDMHTSGEVSLLRPPSCSLCMTGHMQPTRIVVEGYPILRGKTLLEKRVNAREQYDGIRQR